MLKERLESVKNLLESYNRDDAVREILDLAYDYDLEYYTENIIEEEMMDELVKIIEEMGISFAYDHFAEGESPDPPFICYLLSGSDNFAADGRVYLKVNEVHIELYTDLKDLSVEQKVESVLDSHGIFYDRLETWIESEKMYEVLYSFEMEA